MSFMTAAQAAQQKNRDGGGRYVTQERGRARLLQSIKRNRKRQSR